MQHIKTVNGVEIYVTTEGRFQAQIGNRTVTRAALRDLERLLRQQNRAVPGLVIQQRFFIPPAPTRIEVIERLKDGRYRDSDRNLIGSRYEPQVYAYDQAAMDRLEEIWTQMQRLQTEWTQIINGLRRITESDLAAPPAGEKGQADA